MVFDSISKNQVQYKMYLIFFVNNFLFSTTEITIYNNVFEIGDFRSSLQKHRLSLQNDRSSKRLIYLFFSPHIDIQIGKCLSLASICSN